jgi:hypothetical protein
MGCQGVERYRETSLCLDTGGLCWYRHGTIELLPVVFLWGLECVFIVEVLCLLDGGLR